VEELVTRMPIFDQEELAEQDKMIIIIMCKKETMVGQIEMCITSIYKKRINVFIVRKEDILRSTAGPSNKDIMERTGQKLPIWLSILTMWCLWPWKVIRRS